MKPSFEERRTTYRLLNDTEALPPKDVLYFISLLYAKDPWHGNKAAFMALISEVDLVYPECNEEELRLLQDLEERPKI